MDVTSDEPTPEQQRKAEPRWDAAIALLAAGALHLVLAPQLELGPGWLPVACVALMEALIYIALISGKEEVSRALGHLNSAILTAFLLVSVVLLVGLVIHHGSPLTLLKSAVALWIVNIVVFATWYWRLDAGGPAERDKRPGHRRGSFYFPQMSMPEDIKVATCMDQWSPGFIDYLFLAFCTSTALSPADTGALTRWAKVLIMTQSMISLTVIVLLAARAVNTL